MNRGGTLRTISITTIAAILLAGLVQVQRGEAAQSPYQGCISYHLGTKGDDVTRWTNACNVSLVFEYWWDNDKNCSLASRCGLSISARGTQSDHWRHTSPAHVIQCKYPDAPVVDHDGRQFHCPSSGEIFSPESAHAERGEDRGGSAALAQATKRLCSPETLSHPPLFRFYPSLSERNGETGKVGVIITIGVGGAVTATEIDTSSGFPRLDEAAQRVARATTFDTSKCARADLPVHLLRFYLFSARNLQLERADFERTQQVAGFEPGGGQFAGGRLKVFALIQFGDRPDNHVTAGASLGELADNVERLEQDYYHGEEPGPHNARFSVGMVCQVPGWWAWVEAYDSSQKIAVHVACANSRDRAIRAAIAEHTRDGGLMPPNSSIDIASGAVGANSAVDGFGRTTGCLFSYGPIYDGSYKAHMTRLDERAECEGTDEILKLLQ